MLSLSQLLQYQSYLPVFVGFPRAARGCRCAGLIRRGGMLRSDHQRKSEAPNSANQQKQLILLPRLAMSPPPVDDATHGSILSDSLRRLQLKEQVPSSLVEPSRHGTAHADNGVQDEQGIDESGPSSPSHLPRSAHGHVYEGYGFRLTSGAASPLHPPPQGTATPLPDPNGLGWPGERLNSPYRLPVSQRGTAKSTVARLNATPEERAAREEKLAGAVRTLLECIGEDPDREGLVRTPMRYAQALMFLTKGYEERLTGAPLSPCAPSLAQFVQTS